jgi:DNA-binding transcriptional MerR regulator
MKVSEVAKHLGVTSETVRFYSRIGGVQPRREKVNGYRNYGDNDVKRLRFVLSARQLGLSVEDIQEILGHADKKKHLAQQCAV